MMRISKVFYLLAAFIFSQTLVFADPALNINPNFVHIDKTNKIVLINQNISKLNATIKCKTKDLLALECFTLKQSISKFNVGDKYIVNSSDNQEYSLYITQLPIISITTDNNIVDEPKVYAEFIMIEPNGNITKSNIGIEIRGGASVWFPKKSYKIEFWEDRNGEETKNYRLLGMRNDDDWNLQAMYNEDLRIRSKTGFELWKLIDTLEYTKYEPNAINGSTQEYSELFLNGEYIGLYAVGEPVDKKQLKLDDDTGELYKGADWGEANTFKSLPALCGNCGIWGGFEIEYLEDSNDWSRIYSFADFVVNSSKIDFDRSYFKLFDLDNSVNYFILLNVLSANDNIGKNIFIAKQNKYGRYFYVAWDLDNIFGADWEGNLTIPTNIILKNGFYERLLLDNSAYGFVSKLVKRWSELRKTVITVDRINDMLYNNYSILKYNNVFEREAMAVENYSADTTHLDSMSIWLNQRIAFLDKEFEKLSLTIDTSIIIVPDGINIYPLPADEYITVSINNYYGDVSIELIDIMGRLAYSALSQNCSKFNVSSLAPGAYYLIMRYNDVVVKKMVIIQ